MEVKICTCQTHSLTNTLAVVPTIHHTIILDKYLQSMHRLMLVLRSKLAPTAVVPSIYQRGGPAVRMMKNNPTEINVMSH